MTVNVTLNSYDSDGNQADSTNMDLKDHQVSDIVDSAAQLILAVQAIAGETSKETLARVHGELSELEEALIVAGVLNGNES